MGVRDETGRDRTRWASMSRCRIAQEEGHTFDVRDKVGICE